MLCSPHWSPSRKATANEQAPRNRSLSPSAVIILPGSTPHFHCAKSGEYVTQVTVMGPLDWNTSARKTIRETTTRSRSLNSFS